MKRGLLGSTGLEVSALGLGTWALGSRTYGETSEEEADATIAAALDAGITLFDSAPLYGRDGRPGYAETLLGRAIAGRRDKLVITTKFGRGRKPGTEFDARGARESVEESLVRLGTDRIDVLFFHSPFSESDINHDVWDALDQLRSQGKVRFLGHSVSNYSATSALADRWIAEHKISVVQVVLSLMNRETLQSVRAWAASGIGVLARETLANGFLSGTFRPDTVFPSGSLNARYSAAEVADRVAYARQFEFLVQPPLTNLAQAATRWVLDQEGVSCALCGSKSKDELRQVCAAESAPAYDAGMLRRAHEIHSRDFQPA